MPHSPLPRNIATLAIAAAALLGLSACSSDEPAETSAPETTETTETTDADTDTTDDVEAAPEGDGSTPAWAHPLETPGELLTTIEGENFEVAVYQVDVVAATKTGNFADPETNEPLIAVGDDIVFVNYVITNTGDETIPLSFNTVNIDAEYADWPYMQGMDAITDLALYEDLQVNSSALAPGAGEAPFAWAPGETFAYGTNFKHQAGSPITFSAILTPADDEGELLHDEREEVEAEATIT